MYKFLGGELRDEYLPGDLKVSSVDRKPRSAAARAITTTFCSTSLPRVASALVSAGGGGRSMKELTGDCHANTQQSALLTNTHQASGLASLAAASEQK